MEYTSDAVPAQFWRIKYDQDHDGNAPLLPSISESPNCQNFAYALLKHFGYEISPFRSSDLWEDTQETVVVTGKLQALDLLSTGHRTRGERTWRSTWVTERQSI